MIRHGSTEPGDVAEDTEGNIAVPETVESTEPSAADVDRDNTEDPAA